MKHAIDPSLFRVLREGVEKGYFTLEHLDRPSWGFQTTTRVDREWFKLGYEGVQHRNLLRDEVKPHPETVQATPDPRDFVPAPVPPTQPTQPDPNLCPF